MTNYDKKFTLHLPFSSQYPPGFSFLQDLFTKIAKSFSTFHAFPIDFFFNMWYNNE